MLVVMRPSGACRRISLVVVGCWVISYVPVGVESRSELIGLVVKVVCLECHPRICGLVGGRGEVRNFLRISALMVW